MEKKSKIVLSMVAAMMLFGGCGSETTPSAQEPVILQALGSSSSSGAINPVLSAAEQNENNDSTEENNTTTENSTGTEQGTTTEETAESEDINSSAEQNTSGEQQEIGDDTTTTQTTTTQESNTTTENNTSTEDDLVQHILDKEMIHLHVDESSFDLNGTIVSYVWRDMDNIVLSRTNDLNRTLHYYEIFDKAQDGTTKFIKTVTVETDLGEEASKSYTIYVHKRVVEADNGGQAVLGPLSNARYSIVKVGATASEPLLQGWTTQGNGVDVNSAGVIAPESALLESLEEGYYLIEVTGGEDIDNDDNLVWDERPKTNKGVISAVVSDKELKSGKYKVNILTHLLTIYLQKSERLQTSTNQELKGLLDEATAEVLGDVDGNGLVDYADMLAWTPSRDKDKVLVDYDTKVAPVVLAVEEGNFTISYGTFDVSNILPTVHNIYDNEGHLIEQRKDGSPAVTKWVYDAQGVLLYKYYDHLGDGSLIDTYTYEDGRLVEAILQIDDHEEKHNYYYDDLGRLTREVIDLLGDGSQIETILYDGNGNILSDTITTYDVNGNPL